MTQQPLDVEKAQRERKRLGQPTTENGVKSNGSRRFRQAKTFGPYNRRTIWNLESSRRDRRNLAE